MKKDNQHNESEELKRIAPTLHGIEKRNNFKIPGDYFSKVISNVESKVREDSSTILSDMQKQNNFEVPENYFDNLADRITDRINEEKREDAKVVSIKKRNIIRYISIAASVAAIITLIFLLNNLTTIKNNDLASIENGFEQLTAEEFEDEFFMMETGNLFTSTDFEDIDDYAYDYEENDIELDFTSSEFDENLSSDYYFDVEF